MIAAVLSAGPSLLATWPDRDLHPDVILAVNVAAEVYPCDWWVAGDPEAFDGFIPAAPPRCGVVTDALNYSRQPWWPRSGRQVQRWCEMRAPIANGQYHTSGPASVGFAALVLGATEIHTYGMDLSGDRNIDGDPASTAAGAANRWRNETRYLRAIAARHAGRIIRHLADRCELVEPADLRNP